MGIYFAGFIAYKCFFLWPLSNSFPGNKLKAPALFYLSAHSQFDHVHSLRGVSRDHVQDFKGALADYEIQVKLSPQEPENYYSRGNARRELNDCQGAIADFDTAITLNPNAPTYLTGRGIANFTLKQFPEAAKDMDKAIALDSGFAEGYANRGFTKLLTIG